MKYESQIMAIVSGLSSDATMRKQAGPRGAATLWQRLRPSSLMAERSKSKAVAARLERMKANRQAKGSTSYDPKLDPTLGNKQLDATRAQSRYDRARDAEKFYRSNAGMVDRAALGGLAGVTGTGVLAHNMGHGRGERKGHNTGMEAGLDLGWDSGVQQLAAANAAMGPGFLGRLGELFTGNSGQRQRPIDLLAMHKSQILEDLMAGNRRGK